MGHTPGPWCLENIGVKENCIAVGVAWRYDDPAYTQVGGHIRNDDGNGDAVYYTEAVCFVEDGALSDGDMWANARLIAAAPAMLEALARLISLDGDCDHVEGRPDRCPGLDGVEAQQCHWCEARAAIAAATGEQK
jgi:hypothetical protein